MEGEGGEEGGKYDVCKVPLGIMFCGDALEEGMRKGK